jgi:hypothetical protein
MVMPYKLPEWIIRQRRGQRLAFQLGLTKTPPPLPLMSETTLLERARDVKQLNPHLSDDQAMDVVVMEAQRLPAFSNHDEQRDWAALTCEMIDDGIDPTVACQRARCDMKALAVYAAEWDAQVAELVPFTPTAA